MRFDATSYEMGRQAGGGGGGSAVIESITITQNGTTTAPSGVDGYSPITVEVAAPAINLQNKSVSANGTYTADQGYDGLGQVVVSVAGGQNQYDLTGNIDGVFASPQATQWFGANYAYINSISNITSMKATFSGVSATPNKSITLSTNGADCRDAFKGANLSALPSISGKITAADHIFQGANITTLDLSNTTYDPDFDKEDTARCYMFCDISSVDTITMPAAFATYSYQNIFTGNVKHIVDTNTTYTQKGPSGWTGGFQNAVFNGCSYLRELPANLVAALGNFNFDGEWYAFYNEMCQNCNDLDEIVNLPVIDITESYGNNAFNNIASECNHLKRFTFAAHNGTVSWDNYTINLTNSVGYGQWTHLPAAKEIEDAASYAALKNDPDAWTQMEDYSRYDHDSAVETINSLPALTTGSQGTHCEIAFYGNSGLSTDAGAISTLTANEIAVATTKGWTVALS